MLPTELKPIAMSWPGFRNLGVLNVIERRPFESLSGGDWDWLKAKHHFSFEDSKGRFDQFFTS